VWFACAPVLCRCQGGTKNNYLLSIARPGCQTEMSTERSMRSCNGKLETLYRSGSPKHAQRKEGPLQKLNESRDTNLKTLRRQLETLPMVITEKARTRPGCSRLKFDGKPIVVFLPPLTLGVGNTTRLTPLNINISDSHTLWTDG